MMLDRLRVADLKDEIVSMQAELNNVLFEQHQKSQMVIKTETTSPPVPLTSAHHQNQQIPNTQQISNQVQIVQSTSQQPSSRIQQCAPIMQEPSQILKAKQELKLFENIKSERVKIESQPTTKDSNKTTFGFAPLPAPSCHLLSQQKSPNLHPQPKQTKFDKLKNEQISVNVNLHHNASTSQVHSPTIVKQTPELKEELESFDIESEIRPNLIMKKCDSMISTPPPLSHNITKKGSKQKEREFSPLSDYFSSKITTLKSKNDNSKNDNTQDGTYDEWLSIQKELNLQLPSSSCATNKKRDVIKCTKSQPKCIDNDLSDIFEHHSSPKSVEKQLDDLFSSSSKSGELIAAPSPLTEFFHVEQSNLGEKTVENRLEALFGESEDQKANQQDMVETRLEQLFQGSVAENDESALDNASFLYKNTDMTYEMIQKQIQVSTSNSTDTGNGNASNAAKRQWSGTCDIFASSAMFPSTSPSSKRACTAVPTVSFDNKWIEDSFDFATEIMSTESSGDDITKHRSWNGNIDHRETMISGIHSPNQNQFHLSTGDESNIQHHNHSMPQNEQHMNMIERQDQLMDTQIPNLNYDDVDDISRQVQNAIDSILNLQSTDPLHYQLDSSFLELNTITAPSGTPSSPINVPQSQVHQVNSQQHLSQYQMHNRTDHQIHGFSNQKASGSVAKRKYSRMDDIGDCLIGGSNLDDSPSALALADSHGGESSSASVGEFVNNLLNCEEKSITTS